MNVKLKKSAPISRDSDTPPEITDAWIAGADLYHGDKLVRRGRPKLANPRQLLSLRLPTQVGLTRVLASSCTFSRLDRAAFRSYS